MGWFRWAGAFVVVVSTSCANPTEPTGCMSTSQLITLEVDGDAPAGEVVDRRVLSESAYVLRALTVTETPAFTTRVQHLQVTLFFPGDSPSIILFGSESGSGGKGGFFYLDPINRNYPVGTPFVFPQGSTIELRAVLGGPQGGNPTRLRANFLVSPCQ